MLSILPESRKERRRPPASALLSAAAHIAVIAAATYASAGVPPGEVPVIPSYAIIHFQPPAEPHQRPPAGDARQARRGGPAAGPPTLPPRCNCVPPGLPPIEATLVGSWDATVDPAELSTPPGGSAGGAGDGAPIASEYADTPAEPLRGNPLPRYPELLRTAGIGGAVVVRFVVDSAGRVEPGSAVVELSDHDALEREVRAVLPRLRFRPATVNGRRVRVLAQQRFVFGIER